MKLTKLVSISVTRKNYPGTYQSVRGYWWGHDTLEDQWSAEKKKKEKDVISWTRPGVNLQEKNEFLWAPNRVSQEAAFAKEDDKATKVSFIPKWTGTTDLLSFTTKAKPKFWKLLFYPEEYMEDMAKNRYALLVKGQEFIKERLLVLGPDLSAAHFLCYNNCRVRFRGHKEWTELNAKGGLDIPAVYVPGWFIEAIDCSSSKLVFEGLQNLRNLHYLKYLDISYCEHIDVWCLDRITGEYADTLEYLNLSGCRNLTAHGLEVLWRLKNLKTLVLKDMEHVEDLTLVCLLLLDVFPNLKIIGAEYMDLKLLEGTEHAYLLQDDFIPQLEPGAKPTQADPPLPFRPRQHEAEDHVTRPGNLETKAVKN